jgi:hypothetical protein
LEKADGESRLTEERAAAAARKRRRSREKSGQFTRAPLGVALLGPGEFSSRGWRIQCREGSGMKFRAVG